LKKAIIVLHGLVILHKIDFDSTKVICTLIESFKL